MIEPNLLKTLYIFLAIIYIIHLIMGTTCTKVGKTSPKSSSSVASVADKDKAKKSPSYISNKRNEEVSNDLVVKKASFVVKQDKNPIDAYLLLHKLGSGTYGSVNLVKHRLTEVERAMKKIRKEKKLDKELQKKKDEEIMNEIEILKSIDHPNIVKIYEFFSTPDYYYLVTEFCKGGELFDQFEKYAPFDEFHAAFIMYQIFTAVHYCHLKRIVHRDLKPENILIEKQNNDGYFLIKVIDFGTAKLFKKDKMERTLIGSPYYIAPEVINRHYNEKCDLWSCGVIFYILLSNKLPFNGEDDKEVFENIQKGDYNINLPIFNKVSSEAKDLIKKLLVLDPDKRINLKNVLSHKFFEKKKIKEYICGVSKEKILHCLKNINDYRSEFVLQTTVLAFLVHNFTHHEAVKDVSKFFNIFDNGIEQADGKLTREEVIKGLAKFMPKSEVIKNVDSIFTKIDTDGNGYIEYEEFVGACIDKNIFLQSNILKFAFNFFDKDSSGTIDLNELEEIFCAEKTNSDELRRSLKEVIKSIDVNGDGEIDFEEFTNMMVKIIKSSTK